MVFMSDPIIKYNTQFVGRALEWATLEKIGDSHEASILIMYGRRRIGKTELLEQVYRKRQLIKIEGIEGQTSQQQLQNALRQLARYIDDPIFSHVKVNSWLEFFEIIYQYTKEGMWTIYFEEVQWLASYQNNFISELKYVWDNFFRHNNKLLLILCGSSPSFMINHVLHSKALYNRSQYEMPLREFTISETALILKGRSKREVMDAYLTVGGVPDYLKRLNKESSVWLGICQNAFTSGGYLVHEESRIFTSSMADNKHYKKIVQLLSKSKFLTRSEITQKLKIKSGGVLSDTLYDLEMCGFIEKYVPYNLSSASKLARFCISDAYLQFYFKFIQPKLQRIQSGEYDGSPTQAINPDTYHKWLGFSFERFCRKNHFMIADMLGFRAVNYKSGAFYNRATDEEQSGYQIDLLFERDDKVVTICEIKYTQAAIGMKVIAEMERKLELFPNVANKTIQRVLISAAGVERTLVDKGYFDRILTLPDFFKT